MWLRKSESASDRKNTSNVSCQFQTSGGEVIKNLFISNLFIRESSLNRKLRTMRDRVVTLEYVAHAEQCTIALVSGKKFFSRIFSAPRLLDAQKIY
jgi:hypothetical protein